jgi:nicotinate-nucleotide adenylyltransferase
VPPEANHRFPVLAVLYGGTFDPVHNGHLGVARHARDILRAQIRLMPAADPPHKGPTHADAAQRAEMLALAVDDEPGLRVDLRELRRSGPSYTVDTLRELRADAGPNAPWAILVGADSFRAFDAWHRWRELFALAHIVVAERAGGAIDPVRALRETLPPVVAAEAEARWTENVQDLHAQPAGRMFALRQPLFPESASDLRRRIAEGRPWRNQVPPAVADYILAHGLYR